MKIITLSICALFATCAPGLAMDFTPHPAANVQTFLRAFFLDGKTRYAVNLPPKTTMTGGPSKVLFFLNGLDGGTFSIGLSPLTPDVPFTEPDLEKYRNAALALAGSASVKAVIKKEENGPSSINSWPSFRFSVAIEPPGRRILQTVTFLNFTPKEQWVLITAAPEKFFGAADDQASTIFRSFRKLVADEDLSAPVYP